MFGGGNLGHTLRLMIEALPLLFVAAVAAASYAGARAYAAGPVDRGTELARLEMQRDSLTKRLQQARLEGWGVEMETQLHAQLASIEAQLAQYESRD
jgi:hypothetical protein